MILRLRPEGLALVALGAAAWGTDGLFRRGLALELPASTVVFAEHLVLVVLTAPLVVRAARRIRLLTGSERLYLVIVGFGSSVLATVLFTKAFTYGDATSPLLLQKLQPLFAVLAARMVLQERLRPRYWIFFILGITGAYLIAFPDPDKVTLHSITGGALAVGAAALWGLGTVLGRRLTRVVPFNELTALRFAVGLPASVAIMVALGEVDSLSGVGGSELVALITLALVPGLLALMIYYRGLQKTPASAATIAELSFPLTAIVVNRLAFGDRLSVSQGLGVLVLSSTIVVMSWLSTRGTRELGIIDDQHGKAIPEGAALSING